MNGMNKNEQFLKVFEMSQNRLNRVGIDLTSVPEKFGDPGTSRTMTKEVYWSASDPLISIWSFHCHGPRLSRGPRGPARAAHNMRSYCVRTALFMYVVFKSSV